MDEICYAMITPPEIIQDIMEYAVSPHHILPFTYRPLVHSDGHPQPKLLPIISVCKSWYQAGLPLVYRDILIESLEQLNQLVDTLKQPECSNFRPWVQSLEIRDIHPEEIGSTEFHLGIDTLLQLCPNLTKYAYQQSARGRYGIISLPKYPTLMRPITDLHLQWVLSPQELVAALKGTCESLESLHISFAKEAALEKWPAVELAFPNLHTLSVPQSSRAVDKFQKWEMPKLTRLLFWLDYAASPAQPLTHDTGKMFFEKYGPNIKVLQMYRWHYTSSIDNDLTNGKRPFTTFMEHLPALEHLVLHYRGSRFPSQQFRHPTVKWVDVWSEKGITRAKNNLEKVGFYPDRRRVRDTPFPAVQGIRIFPMTLYSWTHLPFVVPPTASALPVVFKFPAVTGKLPIWSQFLYASSDILDLAEYEPYPDSPEESDSTDGGDADEDWQESLEVDGSWGDAVDGVKEETIAHRSVNKQLDKLDIVLRSFADEQGDVAYYGSDAESVSTVATPPHRIRFVTLDEEDDSEVESDEVDEDEGPSVTPPGRCVIFLPE